MRAHEQFRVHMVAQAGDEGGFDEMDYNLSLEPDLAFVEGRYGQANSRRLFQFGRHHRAVGDAGVVGGVVAIFLAVGPQADPAFHARTHGQSKCYPGLNPYAVAFQYDYG